MKTRFNPYITQVMSHIHNIYIPEAGGWACWPIRGGGWFRLGCGATTEGVIWGGLTGKAGWGVWAWKATGWLGGTAG